MPKFIPYHASNRDVPTHFYLCPEGWGKGSLGQIGIRHVVAMDDISALKFADQFLPEGFERQVFPYENPEV